MKTLTHSDIHEGRIDLPGGYTAHITIKQDVRGMKEPWKEHEGHGVVSEYVDRDKRAGERVVSTCKGRAMFYDFAATMLIARRDGWGLCDDEKAKLAARLGRKPTKREIIAEAVERDFLYCKGWANDEWTWMGYIVTVEDPKGREIGNDSCWGFDGDTEYFRGEIAGAINHLMERACKEVAERSYWESRDMVTV